MAPTLPRPESGSRRQTVAPRGSGLAPFRRRIRLLRVWRCSAAGGTGGAGAAILLILADYFGWLPVPSWILIAAVAAGLLAGVLRGLFEPLSDRAVARSVDMRADLADRLVSAAEIPAASGSFASALHDDAARKADGLDPGALYPLRPGRWHALFAGVALIAALLFILADTSLLKTPGQKVEAARSAQAAAQIERVARPFMHQAEQPAASPQEQALARALRRFTSDLQHGRLSREQALVRANELAEQARKLTQPQALSLAQRVNAAQTAADKLAQMAAQAAGPKSGDARLADQASALSQQIAALQQRLAAAASGQKKMSAQEKANLMRQLADARKALRQVQLSEQARQFLEKLQSLSDFKKAQQILNQLAAEAAAQQAGQQGEMTPEQMEEAAKQLEELAKRMGSQAGMEELARELLAAAEAARLARNGELPTDLMALFGLNQPNLPPGFSLFKGRGGTNPGVWMGGIGHLDKTSKSSLLKVKFQDRAITSQIGNKGPQSYMDFNGPAALGDRSGVPYQAVLPTYEKMAESALDKSDIPPRERARVRNYFDSLRK